MNSIGACSPYPYYPTPQSAYDPFGGYAGQAYPLATLQGLGGYSIVGQGTAQPEKSMTDKAKDFLNKESVGGIKNGYLLGGAAALGAIWYGYSAGWFGR